jgi:hypothetical protein
MRGMLTQSVLIALLAIPLLAAQQRSAVRGFKMALYAYLAFGLIYMFALRYIYQYLS